MSVQCEATGKRAAGASMPFFERYLSLWVALCIVAGIVLGRTVPGLFEGLDESLEGVERHKSWWGGLY